MCLETKIEQGPDHIKWQDPVEPPPGSPALHVAVQVTCTLKKQNPSAHYTEGPIQIELDLCLPQRWHRQLSKTGFLA
jgi:hypothetical protein